MPIDVRRYASAVLLCHLALALAVAPAAHSQALPAVCLAVPHGLPAVLPGDRISGDVVQRAVVDSAVVALQAGTGHGMPPMLRSAWRADSLGIAAGLAEAVADPSRYGTKGADAAAQLYRALGGWPQPILLVAELNLEASRRAGVLSAVRSLETVRDSAAVLGFACDATWQLLAFVAEPAYATKWAVARHDYWPDLAIAVIRESVRLLGEERMTQFGPVLSALERSPLALESPMGP